MKLPKLRSLILIALVVLLLPIAALAIFAPLDHIYNYLKLGEPSLQDYKLRPTRIVKASAQPEPLPRADDYNQKQIPSEVWQKLAANDTDAFIVLQNGRVKYENYWNGYDAQTKSNSFSISKTLVAMLTGIALEEGKIKSLDQPVCDFLAYFCSNGKEKITLKHLLTMSSGLNFHENDAGYFAFLGRIYYGDDLEKTVKEFQPEEEPGKIWWYRSGDTAVMGLVLEKIYGRNLSDLFSEKIYSRVNSETDAQWTTDAGNHHELPFCCFNTTAREFARIGQLMLDQGEWRGQQIISKNYYQEMTTPAKLRFRTSDKNFERYGYYTHLFKYKDLQIISPNGYRGQYILVVPEKRAVIVRLGASDWKKQQQENFFFEDNFWTLDAGLSLLD